MYKPKYYNSYAKSLYSGMRTGAAVAKAAQYVVNTYKKRGKAKSKATSNPSINTTRVVGKTYKKRAFKKKAYKKPTKQSIPSMKRDIKKLQSKVKDGESVCTYRLRTAGKVSCNTGEQTLSPIISLPVSTIESVLGNLLYFDPANPNTLVSASGVSATYQRNYRFQSTYTKVTFRNNYQIPCKLTVYVSAVKADTSITVTQAYANGLADNPGSALSITSPLSYLTDSDQYKHLWKLLNTKTIILQPGQEYVYSHSSDLFDYDPSVTDSHTTSYQKAYKSFSIDARIEGLLGHDIVVTNEQGTLSAALDLLVDRTFKVIYDSGINLDYVIVSNLSDTTFTTANPVLSQQPVAGNQSFKLD
ncbi:MAG: putative capsid protein [Circoviridae sp.]|nr:MAG: putative capsid protein [Circoviridae sp.]